MPYRLRDGLSYCRVDNYLVFLDIEHDQYFRLPDRMERSFSAYMEGSEESERDVSNLVERNILTCAASAATDTSRRTIDEPLRSAMEQSSPCIYALGPAALLSSVSIVCSMQLRLKTRRLMATLEGLVAYREKNAPQSINATTDAMERILESAAIFRHARLYAPVETRCLLDSLSMVSFLAKRGLHASLVFGVTGHPFSAHCWVQAGDMVLNDTVGNAKAHTPIRVV